jgi:hypothetical protein
MRATKFVRLRRLFVVTAMGAGLASAVGPAAIAQIHHQAVVHADAVTAVAAVGGTVAQARPANADELTWG